MHAKIFLYTFYNCVLKTRQIHGRKICHCSGNQYSIINVKIDELGFPIFFWLKQPKNNFDHFSIVLTK